MSGQKPDPEPQWSSASDPEPLWSWAVLDGNHQFRGMTGFWLVRVSCSCGWRTRRHLSIDRAADEMIMHQAASGRPVNP